MKSGLIANVIGTWAHPSGFRVRTEICGDKGMLQFDSEEAPISVMMRKAAGDGLTMIVPGSPVADSPYQLEWEDFLGWIEGKHKPRVTPNDALQAVRMAAAALKSNETGKPENLSLSNFERNGFREPSGEKPPYSQPRGGAGKTVR